MPKKIEIDEPLLIDLYLKNGPISGLEERFNLNKTTIYKILKKHNIQKNKFRPEKIDKENQIIEDYKNGMITKDILNKYQIKDPGSLYCILNKRKIQKKFEEKRDIDFNQILKLYNGGKSPKEIGEIVNRSRGLIRKLLIENNIKLRKNRWLRSRKTLRSEKHGEIVDLYNNGMNISQISKKIGCSWTEIKNILRKYHVKFISTHLDIPNFLNKNKEGIISFYKEGKTLNYISKIYNCKSDTIKTFLIKNNIEVINHKKRDSEIRSIILNLYKNNSLNTLQISHQLNMSIKQVSSILYRLGVRTSKKVDVKQIIELYKSGKHINEIAKILNYSNITIRKILNKNNIIIRRDFIPEDNKNKIIDLYKSGLFISEAARIVGCSDVGAGNILKDNGITIRPFYGENSSGWKGGISPFNKVIRTSTPYLEWKIKCFILSNRASEISGCDENIQCHHVYPFKNIFNSSLAKHKCLENEKFTLALTNDSRFYDTDNGLVITEEEHKVIEKTSRDCHPYWKIWQAFPNFALKKFDFTEGQYLSFNENGQLNRQDAKVCASNITEEIKRIIRYEHYLGTIPPHTIILTAQINGIIAGIATFGQGANKNMPKDCWELTRLCVPYYVVRPFTIKFLNMCIDYIKENHKDIKQLISYADPNVGHDGAVYRMSGWKKEGKTKPSYAYFDPNINQLKHKSYCRRIKGIDKTELELAKERGLIKINLLPKKKYSIILNQCQFPHSI